MKHTFMAAFFWSNRLIGPGRGRARNTTKGPPAGRSVQIGHPSIPGWRGTSGERRRLRKPRAIEDRHGSSRGAWKKEGDLSPDHCRQSASDHDKYPDENQE